MSVNGACGPGFWIADELWRLAHRQPRGEAKAEFIHTVALLIAISENSYNRRWVKRRQQRGRIEQVGLAEGEKS